jgi:hypothetical protein
MGVRGLAISVVTALVATAHADPAPLDYRGACDERALRDEVDRLASPDPFAREVPKLTITVEPTSTGIRGTVSHAGAARTIEAATCDALVPELAFVIATILAQRASAIEPQAAVKLPTPASAGEIKANVAPPSPRARYEALVGGALTDERAIVGSLGARLRGGRLSLAVELAMSRSTIGDASAAVHVSRQSAIVAPCIHAGRVAGCATAEVGRVQGRGEGYAVSSTSTSPHAAVGMRASLEQRVGSRFAVGVRLDLTVALTRNRFLVDDMTVWQSSHAGASLGLFAIARIP